jgi:hypothetical protein
MPHINGQPNPLFQEQQGLPGLAGCHLLHGMRITISAGSHRKLVSVFSLLLLLRQSPRQKEHSRLNHPCDGVSLPPPLRRILETAKEAALSDVSEWPRTDHKLMAGK